MDGSSACSSVPASGEKMNNKPDWMKIAGAIACIYFGTCNMDCPCKKNPEPPPAPIQPLNPHPQPPLVPPRPSPTGKAWIGGPKHIDGTEVACDIPHEKWMENSVGTDNSGLCVFTSINVAAFWQHVKEAWDFQQKMRRELGGGWPEKVDKMIAKYCPGVEYVQYEGPDSSILDLAIKSGRMPCVTYGFSERYQDKNGRGGQIAHMVNLVHLDSKWACVLDNNFVAPASLEWMSRDEFFRRWKLGSRGNKDGWAVVLLRPPPPPVPHN